jgi:hypothetical protein
MRRKPVVFSIVGVAAIGVVVWLAMRAGDPAAPAEKVAADALAPAALTHPENSASVNDNSAASATAQPAAAAERVAPLAVKQDGDIPLDSLSTALPIDVSPGFEYLAKPAAEMSDTDSQWTLWRRHQQLQSEPRDDSWAPRIEAEFRRGIEDALTAAGLDTQRIELPVVECRTRGCEMQAVGYSADNRNPKADFQIVVLSLLREKMGDEFDLQGVILSMSPRSDGRIAFLVQVPRKKP